ncbi:DNA-packaging protein [Celeribacter sp. PS-C1]|uniref:DNA-packaging protein n=1 Tax=Celeribacter sp. PS-C1 TaxID=2820813 RepID=UPI001CA56595|nr:DNA-packaging protein [Celeribacter sp. PS-C1]MBW6419517.1 DNA-packaging protein [Celeribacter sp. PS-C1]
MAQGKTNRVNSPLLDKYLDYCPDPEAIWEIPVGFDDTPTSSLRENGSGNPARFDSPMELWEACRAYLRWCVGNPRHEAKFFHHDGVGKTHKVNLARVPTLTGLCSFLGVSQMTLNAWSNPDAKNAVERFHPVMEHFRNIIFDEKYSGAAVGTYNAGFMARDLGLMENFNVSGLPETNVTNNVTVADPFPQEDRAVCVHPDDPDPFNPDGPRFTMRQIAMGIPFFAPNKEQYAATKLPPPPKEETDE